VNRGFIVLLFLHVFTAIPSFLQLLSMTRNIGFVKCQLHIQIIEICPMEKGLMPETAVL